MPAGSYWQDAIDNTTGNAVWAADDASFLYAVIDENWRPWQVRRHVLGQPVDDDAVVYEEQDSGFFVGVAPSTSREYIIIGAADHVTSEVRLIPSSDPEADSHRGLTAPHRATNTRLTTKATGS